MDVDPPSTTPSQGLSNLIQSIYKQRDDRLARTRNIAHEIAGSLSTLLHHSRIPDTEITSDVTMATEGAKISAATESLIVAVEAALDLVEEIRRDALLHQQTPPMDGLADFKTAPS